MTLFVGSRTNTPYKSLFFQPNMFGMQLANLHTQNQTNSVL